MASGLDSLTAEELDRILRRDPVSGEPLQGSPVEGDSWKSYSQSDIDGRNRDRVPVVISCRRWVREEGGKRIVMWLNPQQVSFSLPERASEEPTRTGVAVHEYPNPIRGGSTISEPRITFTLSTGNVLPRRSDVGPIALPPGHKNLYDFLTLKHLSKVCSDGEPNYIYIAYNSVTFPKLLMSGMFAPTELSIEDDAENPFSISYTCEFILYSSSPAFESAAQLIEAFRDSYREAAVIDFGNAVDQTTSGSGVA